MNLRTYYQNVKRIREGLPEPYVFLTSLSTPNGGKEGIVTEVETSLAARMIADLIARIATSEEIAAYQANCDLLRAEAKEDELRSRLRVTLVNEPDIRLETNKPERGAKKP
jgi:hypothetical protein